MLARIVSSILSRAERNPGISWIGKNKNMSIQQKQCHSDPRKPTIENRCNPWLLKNRIQIWKWEMWRFKLVGIAILMGKNRNYSHKMARSMLTPRMMLTKKKVERCKIMKKLKSNKINKRNTKRRRSRKRKRKIRKLMKRKKWKRNYKLIYKKFRPQRKIKK